jgi:hypothetical protein
MFTQWIHSYRDLPLLINQVNAVLALFVTKIMLSFMMGQFNLTKFFHLNECALVGKCHKMGDAH